jgi:hypothetical protein
MFGFGFNALFLAFALLSYNTITNAIAPVNNDNSVMQGIYDLDQYYYLPTYTPIVLLHGITSDTSELAPVAE